MAEDHCWISIDGKKERCSAAEVAAARTALQGEPPSSSAWGTWLYCAGVATVCSAAQVVAAVLTSMDTCIGEKATNESDPARALQRGLLSAVFEHNSAALYPNAACVMAELQQDEVLDAAREAAAGGADARQRLQQLQAPYAAMRQAAGDCGADLGTARCTCIVGRCCLNVDAVFLTASRSFEIVYCQADLLNMRIIGHG